MRLYYPEQSLQYFRWLSRRCYAISRRSSTLLFGSIPSMNLRGLNSFWVSIFSLHDCVLFLSSVMTIEERLNNWTLERESEREKIAEYLRSYDLFNRSSLFIELPRLKLSFHLSRIGTDVKVTCDQMSDLQISGCQYLGSFLNNQQRLLVLENTSNTSSRKVLASLYPHIVSFSFCVTRTHTHTHTHTYTHIYTQIHNL